MGSQELREGRNSVSSNFVKKRAGRFWRRLFIFTIACCILFLPLSGGCYAWPKPPSKYFPESIFRTVLPLNNSLYGLPVNFHIDGDNVTLILSESYIYNNADFHFNVISSEEHGDFLPIYCSNHHWGFHLRLCQNEENLPSPVGFAPISRENGNVSISLSGIIELPNNYYPCEINDSPRTPKNHLAILGQHLPYDQDLQIILSSLIDDTFVIPIIFIPQKILPDEHGCSNWLHKINKYEVNRISDDNDVIMFIFNALVTKRIVIGPWRTCYEEP